MKKLFLFIVLFNCCAFAQGQSAGAEKKTQIETSLGLSRKYAPKLLEAYRENAKTKVEDLFAYFQMLTDASLTDEYKKEIIKSIQNAFKNQNPEVIDFTSSGKDTILLNTLIDKLLISEPMLFKVSGNWEYEGENALSWTTAYKVTRTKSGINEEIKVSQLVFLFEAIKSFGNNNKKVTVSFLGRME